MDAFSSALTIKALDGLFLRAAATAQNVANAQTPNYRPVRVSFEDALAKAAGRGMGDIGAVQAKIERERLATSDQGLRLDLELATASTTAMRYGALLDVLGRQLQLQSLATTGNS